MGGCSVTATPGLREGAARARAQGEGKHLNRDKEQGRHG